MNLASNTIKGAKLHGVVLASSGGYVVVGVGGLRLRARSQIGELEVGDEVVLIRDGSMGIVIGRTRRSDEGGGENAPARRTSHGDMESMEGVDSIDSEPTGDAGGDLAGEYPDPVVVGLRGTPITSTPPSDGQVLKYDEAAGEYVFADEAGGGNSSVGGDLSGTTDDATVIGIQGRNVSSAQPAIGQVLKWTGSAWEPQNESGSSGGSGTVCAPPLSSPAKPSLSAFTWRNQGNNGSARDTACGIFLQCVRSSSTNDIKALTQPAPNGSFSVTLGFYAVIASVRWHKVGLVVYNPSTNKSLFLMTTNSTNDKVLIQRTRLTAYDSKVWDGPAFNFSYPYFFRIVYDADASLYTFYVAADGTNFVKLPTQEGVAYVGAPPDVEVGFAAMAGNSDIPAAITAVHWDVAVV